MIVPGGTFWLPFLGQTQQLKEQHNPFRYMRAVFPCVQTMVQQPAFGIFNVHADVNACDCAQGSGFQARSKDQEILEEGGGAGPSLLPRRDHE